MNSSIEQGTEGNEKKQQLAKEYKEKVRFGENFFWNNSEAYILMAKYPYEIDEKYLKSFSLRDIWNDLRAHSKVFFQERKDDYYHYLIEMAISKLLANFQDC